MKIEIKKLLIVLLGGILFGFGLAFSSMTKPEVVLSFLQLADLGLMLVMLGAIAVTMPVYLISSKIMRKPVFGDKFQDKKNIFNKKIFLGAVIFGIGWGISGLCPGSAIASLGIGNYPVLIGILGMFIGAYFHGIFKG